MKILCFLLMSAVSCSSIASITDPSRSVPTISPESFPPGKSFVWKYFEDDQLYSTEKYTVLESSPTRVLFQMSTKLASEQAFKLHHRLEVNPTKCLEVYKKPGVRKPWSIRLYYWNKDRWTLNTGLAKTLAFEEKFNCDAHVYKYMYRTTVFENHDTDLGVQELFAHQKHVNIQASWFFLQNEYAGVMAYKKMSKPYEKHQYTIRFSQTE